MTDPTNLNDFAEEKAKLDQLQAPGRRSLVRALRYADDKIFQNHWSAIGFAAAAGMIIGLLLHRSTDPRR
jgi:ElaB/YqjD/DUF883 family membrane-anchored ribosome-binding protein